MKIQLSQLVLLAAITFLMANSAFAAINVGSAFHSTTGASGTDGLDPGFTFSFSLGSDVATGTLNTIDEGNGSFLATSGTLTVTSSNASNVDVGTFSLYYAGSGGTALVSPTGAFIYDDL